jgi:RNA polymerase sigma-70 factor (ECF subfamily)
MLIEREDRDSLRAAILTLPAVYREALVLCDLSELDYRDAARVTGCSVGTVRSRLHRARNLLASKLAGRKRKGREPAERFGVGI